MYALFAALPAVGHINPLLQQAQELQRRHWRVSLASTEELRSHVEKSAPGLPFISVGPVDEDLRKKLEQGAAESSAEPDFTKALVKNSLSFIDAMWHMFFDGLVAAIRADRPDVMIVDYLTIPGLDAAEAEGVPFIVNNADLLTVLPHPLLPPAYGNPLPLSGVSIRAMPGIRHALNHFLIPITNVLASAFMAKLDRKLNECRKSRALGPAKFATRLRGKLVLIDSAFGLEYKRPLSPVLRMVGPMLPDEVEPLTADYEQWLGAGGPVIYVNLGTIGIAPRQQIERMLSGLQSKEWRVLWVLRKDQHSLLPSELPKNVRVEEWGPAPRAVLGHPNVRVFVSHCGTNSVHECLMAGKPIVGIPMLAVQLDMGMRVEDAGVGLMLNKTRFTPEDLRNSIRRVMSDDSFRYNIPSIQVSFREAGGIRRAADLIEDFARSQLLT
jgi:polyene glycosyltransferase